MAWPADNFPALGGGIRDKRPESRGRLKSPGLHLVVDSVRAAPVTALVAFLVAILAGILPLAVAIQSGRVVDAATHAFGLGVGSSAATTAVHAGVVLAGLYL